MRLRISQLTTRVGTQIDRFRRALARLGLGFLLTRIRWVDNKLPNPVTGREGNRLCSEMRPDGVIFDAG